MRVSTCAAAAATVLGLLASSTTAHAGSRQLFGGFLAGATWSSGPQGGIGGMVSLQGAYGLNDAFRLYANLEYSVSAAPELANSPRHAFTFNTGVVYALDVVSVLPWAGVGFQGSVVATPTWLGFIPAVEARGGVDYMPSRYLAVTFSIAYALSLANRDAVGDTLTGGVGLRFIADL